MQQMRPLFVVNPAAGNGRARRVASRISAALGGNAEIVFSANAGDVEKLAYKGAQEGYSPIVGVGGDGTLQEIANGLLRSPEPPPLGIVPAGTGNDLVRSLGLPSEPAEAIRRISSGASSEIDVAVCNERYFLNVGGVGLDARVAKAMNQRTGRMYSGTLPYMLQALVELSRYSNPEFVLHLDGEVLSTRSLLVAVANGRYFAGGMKICPNADPADGFLDVCVAGDLTRREALGLMPAIFSGRHVGHRKVSIHRVRTVCIESSLGMEVQLDGEVIAALPAEFRIIPHALRIAGRETERNQALTVPMNEGLEPTPEVAKDTMHSPKRSRVAQAPRRSYETRE